MFPFAIAASSSIGFRSCLLVRLSPYATSDCAISCSFPANSDEQGADEYHDGWSRSASRNNGRATHAISTPSSMITSNWSACNSPVDVRADNFQAYHFYEAQKKPSPAP